MDDCTSRVLFCNGQYALINKNVGEICSQPKTEAEKAFYVPAVFKDVFLAQYPDLQPEHFQCVNRIDRPVTGVVIVALTADANAALSAMVKKHRNMDKEYWAIVEGVKEPTDDWVTVEQFLSYNQKVQKAFVESKAGNGALPATLEYRVLGHGTNYSFVSVKLITGRTHQIRCQLSSLHMHIKGDLKYGSKRSEKNGGIRLHAAKLSFTDPMNGQKVHVEAPLPYTDPLWDAFSAAYTGSCRG
ncbi:MAG: RluA family pseudouridine synthase [Treponemataceae bacterium]|nr:RluA family pseudouridine synthase [Treponemataceae bacterium]